MGTPSQPETALLFIGALFSKEEHLSTAQRMLDALFGGTAGESPVLPWHYSDYYREELGTPLWRRFLFFRKLIKPETLADIKLMTNGIERELSKEGKRSINLDPGYLTLSKVVLASTKNYSHRIYLGKGIYAEVTLVYKGGQYQPHIFTYPDYASETLRQLFAQGRRLLSQSQ